MLRAWFTRFFFHCEMIGLQHLVGSFGQQCCLPWQQVTPHLLTYGFGQSLRIRLVVVVAGAVVVVVVVLAPLFSTFLFKASEAETTTAKRRNATKNKVENFIVVVIVVL